jgi:transcriptional regulator NrdR family protein
VIRCPKCESSRTKVIGGWLIEDSLTKKRRRKCVSCGKNFNTLEFVIAEGGTLVTDQQVLVLLANKVS